MNKADIGLVGLAVMGQNLVLNMNEHGFNVAVFNRTVSRVDEFLNASARDTQIIGTHSLKELVEVLEKPRRIMLMVKAGQPVDDFIEQLIPLLDAGDIIIDGGNSNYEDTFRRMVYVESKKLLFIGTGISGGEEGARHGPSIMPGGSPAAWPHLKSIFQGIAARVPSEKVGEPSMPCCDWVGENGAGHYVKMVHNGIEYAYMQLLCEAYQLMKEILNMSADEIHAVFAEWNKGKLDSYLIQITADILSFKDEDGTPLLEKILDAAGQKGTGEWTAISALKMGIPINMIIEAVLNRYLSAMKDERVNASYVLPVPKTKFKGDKNKFIKDLYNAVFASKIIAYTQGFMLMHAASQEYKWNLNYGSIAQIWRGGCIIRSTLLYEIKEAFIKNPDLSNLLLDPYFIDQIESAHSAWRQVVAVAAQMGIPLPAMSSALAFYDGYRHEWLPANLLQAQRDYFGAHTYERIDKPRGQFFHTYWKGYGNNGA